MLRDPYPFYADLRRHAPVTHVNRPETWVVSRYEEVALVLRSPRLFSSTLMAGADPVLLGADPPAHTRARRLVNAALSPERVAGLEPRIRAIGEHLASSLAAEAECDCMARLAVPLPVRVVASLLGIDESVSPARLKHWSDAFVLAGFGRGAAQSRPGAPKDARRPPRVLRRARQRAKEAPGRRRGQ